MKNPLNAVLTPTEQQILGYFCAFAIVGMLLYYAGLPRIYATKTDDELNALSSAVQTDSIITIDIRTAGKDELMLLPGIGAKRAEDIIAYRQKKQFESTEELLNISGIGAKTFLNMKPMLLSFGKSGSGVSNPDKLKLLAQEQPLSDKGLAASQEQALDETGHSAEKENPTSKDSAKQSAGSINLNSAGLDELMSLDGIGEVKAKAILAYRKEIGRFTSIEQLLDVKGIGTKTLEKNRSRLSL